MTLLYTIAILSILTYSTFIDAKDESQVTQTRDLSYLDMFSTKDLTSLKYLLATYLKDNVTILIGFIYMIHQKDTVCQMKIFPECVIGAQHEPYTVYVCDHASMNGYPPRNRLIFFADKKILSTIYDASIFLPLVFNMCDIQMDFTKQTKQKCEAMEDIYEASGECWSGQKFRQVQSHNTSSCLDKSEASFVISDEKTKPYAFVHFGFFVLLSGFLTMVLYRRQLFSNSGKFYV